MEYTNTSSSEELKDANHGGPDNIMIRLPNTNGDAIHQGHRNADINNAITRGCSAITANELNLGANISNVEKNYSSFKEALQPYGYQNVKVNVTVIYQ